MKNKKKKGFTLIELIIVLAVLAIIAAIAIPNFMAIRDNSKYKADVQSCETIKRTVLMLVSDETIAAGDKTFNVTVSSGTVTVTAGNTSYSSDTTELQKALKDVKAPQGKTATYENGKYTKGTEDASKYVITINSSGDVVVDTEAQAKNS